MATKHANQSPTLTSHQLGQQVEARVAQWLGDQGCRLVAQNFRCRRGEIDLIMVQDGRLLFIEIRLRRSPLYASASESVTPAKQHKIIQCAQYFLLCHPQWRDYNMRFDVVSLHTPTGTPDWIMSAFDAY